MNLPALKGNENQYVALKRGHNPVSNYDPRNLEMSLKDILTVASFEAGQSMADDATVLFHQTQALVKELKNFSELTIPEVTEAFARGIRNEYGQWYGFCPKTYHQFLKGFKDTPERGKAWIKFLDEQEQSERAENPVYYTPEKWVEMCLHTFKDYREMKALADKRGQSEGDIYDQAEGIKVIVQKAFWTNGAAAAIYDHINERVGAEHPKYPDKKTLVPDEAIRTALLNAAKEEVARMEKDSPGSTGEKTLEFIRKNRLLMHFFDSLIEQKKDLNL